MTLSKKTINATSYQARVAVAHHALFHDDPTDVAERLARFFEEVNETCQAFGMSREDAHKLVDYTYDRPVGEPVKEIGAAMLTLASLAVVAGLDLAACAEADLEKLQRPETIARIRAKRSTRHGRGPLPGFDPSSPGKDGGQEVEAVAAPDVAKKLELWFFRDMFESNRLALFSLFGFKAATMDTMAKQQMVFRRILSSLAASPSTHPVGKRWRVFENIFAGEWGIEEDDEDGEVILPPRRIVREHLDDIVARFNAAISTPQPASTALVEALEVLIDAVGDWSRPTGANGMVPASENHPLCVAAKQGREALAAGKETVNESVV